MFSDGYTLKHPLENYDESVPPCGRTKTSGTGNSDRQDSIFLEPATVYPRKKRYSKNEFLHIWKASNQMCYICKKG